jgi:hypothetical protein
LFAKTGDVEEELGRMATEVDANDGAEMSLDGDDVVETAGTLNKLDQLLEIDSLLPRCC